MKQDVLLKIALILALLSAHSAIPQADQEPAVILIYCGETTLWGDRLADLIKEDARFDAEILIIEDRPTYETIVNFPRVQAVVICPLEGERIALKDVSELTTAYFLDGGAVVGMGFACTTKYAPGLGPNVFSISGNRSFRSQNIGERRVFTYVRSETIPEINGEIDTDKFHMEGYLAYYSGNQKGEYVEIPANGTRHVLYEGEKNAPLVVAYQSEAGGSSLAFPALTVQPVEGKDNYFGHLFEREEFKQLFLNGLKWTIENSPRFDRLRNIAGEALETEASRRADLAEEADRLERKVEGRRLGRLAILWAIGVAFCVVVGLKLVVVRDVGEGG